MFSLLPEDDEELRQLQEQLRRGSRDSFQLLKNFPENPICSITVDEAARTLMIVWKQYATQVQLRFIHETLLRMIRAHGVCKILGDDTALPTVPLEDQEWIAQNWMPRAMGSGLRFIANKPPESYFGKLSIRSIQALAPPDLQFRSFEELRSADGPAVG